MAAIDTPEQAGIEPLGDFAEAHGMLPRGRRPDALREAAGIFRDRFARPDHTVDSVRTVDLADVTYPSRLAFAGAARAVIPWVTLTARLVVVRFRDHEGAPRVLLWGATAVDPRGPAVWGGGEDPMARRLVAGGRRTLPQALAAAGAAPGDVDLAAFDNLQLQDLRPLAGTREPPDGESQPYRALLPRALLLVQRREVEVASDPHPVQRPWYTPAAIDDLVEGRLVRLEGDVSVGRGVALVSAPGVSDGNQSLVLHTSDGTLVVSSNGVSADNWHPHLSKIPGVRRHADLMDREVVPSAGSSECPIDQYDSMVKEKAISGTSLDDPRFQAVVPTAELGARRRQWPLVPTFRHGGVEVG